MRARKKRAAKLDEFGLIAALNRPWGPAPRALVQGPGDDAAIWNPTPGWQTLLTSDLLVEQVHFSLKTISAWALGAKALACSLSDVAAMGGLPRAFVWSIAAPRRPGINRQFFEAMSRGALAFGEAFGAFLAGGDMSSTPGPLTVDVALLGEVEKGRALCRHGARPGDWVVCSGHPGDSAAGLAVLGASASQRKKMGGAAALLAKKHLTPLPRVAAGRWLVSHRAASACIDVSDGLASECGHVAGRSGVAIHLEAEALPLSPAALAAASVLKADARAWALGGGEDYELLFTVPQGRIRSVMERLPRETGTRLSVIGQVKKGKGLKLRREGRLRPLEAKGYRHF